MHELEERARELLNKANVSADEALPIVRALKNLNRFAYARKLLQRVRRHPAERLAQRELHALCTYKDRDLPADIRFKAALEILASDGIPLHKTDEKSIETLGQAGSIYRRMWEHDLDPRNLLRSTHFFRCAFDRCRDGGEGSRSDLAWVGINYAYALDLRSSLVADALIKDGFEIGDGAADPLERDPVARDLAKQADVVRRDLLTRIENAAFEELTRLQQEPGDETAAPDERREAQQDIWWQLSAAGEAHFGLREWSEARRCFESAHALKDAVQSWHLETTARRIASLARIQRHRSTEAFDDVGARHVLEGLLGSERTEAALSAFRGKVGLALSGGGFRASFFHLGVLARLAEADLLRHVEAISCVSGGSILGACYYLKLKELLEEHPDGGLDSSQYVKLVEDLCDEFLAGVKENLRMRIVTNIWSNLRVIFDGAYTRTERIGELLEHRLLRKVAKHPSDANWKLADLAVQLPSDGVARAGEFHPRYDNWARRHKVPMLILNASTLNTGHNWQFTGRWMGEPPGRIDIEVDANERLRRFYLNGAPSPYEHLELGRAVAASACVPGLFDPLSFPGMYDDRTVRLVDGGVFDNQGISALLDEDCTVILISDASGQMATDDDPGRGVMDVSLRSNAILMKRVRQTQIRELSIRRDSGLLRHLMFVHLNKDLNEPAVNWRDCDEPADALMSGHEQECASARTPYEVRRSVQDLLAKIRTDLDSFSDVEAYALMTSGYLMAKRYQPRLNEPVDAPPPVDWTFLRIAPRMTKTKPDPELERLLAVGSERSFRWWRLLKTGGKVGVVVAVALPLLALVVWLWRGATPVEGAVPLADLVTIVTTSLLILGLALVPGRFRRFLAVTATNILLGTVGWVAATLYLLLIEPWNHGRGSIARFPPPSNGAT